MMTDIYDTIELSSQHKEALNAVFEHEYYPGILKEVMNHYGYDLVSITNETSPESICNFWNEFWFNLPDGEEIRTYPFFLICDLAEGDYLRPEDYDDID